MVHALTYLGILLMYMSTESGGLLWDSKIRLQL